MSPKWGYPNYNLLITLLTKSHDPLSIGFRVLRLRVFTGLTLAVLQGLNRAFMASRCGFVGLSYKFYCVWARFF